MPEDSPTRSRATHTQNYESPYVEKARATLLTDIPRVPEVELQPLLSAVLPDVSTDATFKNVCDALLRTSIRNERWWCLIKDPKDDAGHEATTFRFIAEIFDRIVSLAGTPHSQVKCIVAGNTTPLSERANTSRPDAYLLLSKETVTAADSWADIVMPMEFKKTLSAGSSGDDFAKVMWSMHHVMRNDPRRRFVFGLTIENTSARLWFNDRGGIVSSTAFDINKDWKSFVHVVLGITRAKQDELGFDLDVELVNTKTTPAQYDITVRSPGKPKTVYRTVELLSEIGTAGLIGRGTRVWKVQKLNNGTPSGPFYALKDVWVNEDRPIEHEVLAEITGLHSTNPSHFLTVIDAGFALADPSDPSRLDNTIETIRRDKEFSLTGRVLQPRPEERKTSNPKLSGKRKPPTGTRTTGSLQHTPTAQHRRHWNHLGVNRFPRRHYRIVFKEIGVPVHDLRSYQDMIIAIEGGSEGLHAIHLAGYAHRDVSSGNILLVREPDGEQARGVIIDLEYIKKVDSESDPHDVKTGTYEFMAIEVAMSEYLHVKTPPIDEEDSDDVDDTDDSYDNHDTGGTDDTADPAIAVKAPPPFRQNQLHDLESVWWICMWMVFRLVRPGDRPTTRYLNNFWGVFESHAARNAFWREDPLFRRFTTHLPEGKIVQAMQSWCGNLKKIYESSYVREEFVIVAASSLEAARKTQRKALRKLSKATLDYPPDLKYLSELAPLPETLDMQPVDVDEVDQSNDSKTSNAKKRRIK